MTTLAGYKTVPFIDPLVAGSNLERIMQERGMSQKELVARTHIQQGAISRAIRTGRGISFRRWEKIAEALDVPVENIFGVQKLAAS